MLTQPSFRGSPADHIAVFLLLNETEGGSRISPAKYAVRGGRCGDPARGQTAAQHAAAVCVCARPQPHGFPRLLALPALR
jgi:hypothetical protein